MPVGDYVYFSGLFDLPLQNKLGVISSEKKKSGVTKVTVKLCDPIGSLKEVSSDISHFITERDAPAKNFDIEKLVELNKKRPNKSASKSRAEKQKELKENAEFLLDRLLDFEPDNITEESARDWNGHVVPAIERLRLSLDAIK